MFAVNPYDYVYTKAPITSWSLTFDQFFSLFCIIHHFDDQVRIPDTARADGWMCHDATEAVVMKKGYYVKLSTAAIPMPTVSSLCASPVGDLWREKCVA